MKKLITLFIIFALIIPSSAALADEGDIKLVIDTQRAYPGMDKSYAQGYMPSAKNGEADLILPLTVEGDAVCAEITASVDLGDPSSAPFVFRNYVNSFTSGTYDVEGENVSCYLVSFRLELRKDRVNGSYPVKIHAEGITQDGDDISGDFALYVVIGDGRDAKEETSREPAPVPQPRLLVESFEYGPSPLEAGSEARLTVTIKNTSTTQMVKNIKLSFQDQNGEILPAAMSSIYIDRIRKGESAVCSFDIRIADNASACPHLLTVMMEYENSNAVAFMSSDVIVLDITQRIRLEYEQPMLPAKVTEGDNIAFSMNIMNLGKSAVYNVLLKFEIPGLNNGGSVLAGNIQPGESKEVKTNLLVFSLDGEYGNTSGSILLSYENESGERFERVIAVQTRIEKKIAVVPAGTQKTEERDEGSLPWWAWVIGNIVIIAAAGLVVVKVLINRRQRELDERRL